MDGIELRLAARPMGKRAKKSRLGPGSLGKTRPPLGLYRWSLEKALRLGTKIFVKAKLWKFSKSHYSAEELVFFFCVAIDSCVFYLREIEKK